MAYKRKLDTFLILTLLYTEADLTLARANIADRILFHSGRHDVLRRNQTLQLHAVHILGKTLQIQL